MNVPKLRFKEFTDEWIKIDLSTCFEYFSTNSLSREQLSDHGIIKNIHYGDIHKKYGNVVDVENDVAIYIKDAEQINKYEFCCENDIIFADASEDYDGIGKAIELINVNEKLVSGLHTIHARDKKQFFSPLFKGYYFNTPIIHNQIRILANGFKVFGISKDNINNLKVMLPSKQEQEKIAKLLSLLDKKIQLQTKKIEALKLFKKGLINYLFSQNTIMKITVKDLGTIITGTTPSKENNFFWHNGNIPWITPSDIIYERDISNSMVKLTEEGLLNGRYLPKNSILVTCIASIGKNAVLKVNGSCNQQINAIIPNEKFNHNYIYYLMEYISNYMKSIAGASATSIINKNDFEKLNVNVHSITEQIKIDKILSSIETKEKLENEYLHNITKLKTYLFQNMFI